MNLHRSNREHVQATVPGKQAVGDEPICLGRGRGEGMCSAWCWCLLSTRRVWEYVTGCLCNALGACLLCLGYLIVSAPIHVCLCLLVFTGGCICVGLYVCVCPWVYLNCHHSHNRSLSKPPAGAQSLTLLLCSPACLQSLSLFVVVAPLEIL